MTAETRCRKGDRLLLRPMYGLTPARGCRWCRKLYSTLGVNVSPVRRRLRMASTNALPEPLWEPGFETRLR